MFGHAYFGAAYFGPNYWGPAGSTPTPAATLTGKMGGWHGGKYERSIGTIYDDFIEDLERAREAIDQPNVSEPEAQEALSAINDAAALPTDLDTLDLVLEARQLRDLAQEDSNRQAEAKRVQILAEIADMKMKVREIRNEMDDDEAIELLLMEMT